MLAAVSSLGILIILDEEVSKGDFCKTESNSTPYNQIFWLQRSKRACSPWRLAAEQMAKIITLWAVFHDEREFTALYNTHPCWQKGLWIYFVVFCFFLFTAAWGMWTSSSCYSRIQIVLMLQPTYRVFRGFIVNHRDRNRDEMLRDTEASSPFTSTPDYCVAPHYFCSIHSITETQFLFTHAIIVGAIRKNGGEKKLHICTYLNVSFWEKTPQLFSPIQLPASKTRI